MSEGIPSPKHPASDTYLVVRVHAEKREGCIVDIVNAQRFNCLSPFALRQ
jgi:hypothetical protein